MKETKVKLHKDLNIAFAELLRIATLLDLHMCSERLKKSRTFISTRIDHSEISPI